MVSGGTRLLRRTKRRYGASNFVAHHQSMVDGLSRILAVHNDPEIPPMGLSCMWNRAMPPPVSKKTTRWKWRTHA